ncbi:hypothetical protein [Metapseudomonas otitidis]|uniref:hypothetical protein n=1 Tax=Metapseudomonas otitidis TaxID=319939 RepID=UPI0013F61D61|nr:hypothetical protein [Pseudomonas otitidis]
MRVPDIPLTSEELALLSKIRFNSLNHQELRNSLAPMETLALSILKREVVPQIRIAYLTDPELNPGGRGKSRKDIFEKNGTSGDEILRHPHFLKYLEYFIFGPNLPVAVIEKFKSKSVSDHFSGSDMNDLTPYARECVRQNRMEPHRAAEEFYKLAIECGAMPAFAENLKKSVSAVKLR